jgi:hypothetical protein
MRRSNGRTSYTENRFKMISKRICHVFEIRPIDDFEANRTIFFPFKIRNIFSNSVLSLSTLITNFDQFTEV